MYEGFYNFESKKICSGINLCKISFDKSDFLDLVDFGYLNLVKSDFLDWAEFAIVDTFLILPITLLLSAPVISLGISRFFSLVLAKIFRDLFLLAVWSIKESNIATLLQFLINLL